MTAIQATMFANREQARSNRAKEQETNRTNLARELETNRANRAMEDWRSQDLARQIAKDQWQETESKAATKLARDQYDQSNVRYWVDAFGFGPNARDDFATVYTRGIGGGSSPSDTSVLNYYQAPVYRSYYGGGN